MKEPIDSAHIKRILRGLGSIEEKAELEDLRKKDPVLNALVRELENSMLETGKARQSIPLMRLADLKPKDTTQEDEPVQDSTTTPAEILTESMTEAKPNVLPLKEQATRVRPMYTIGKGVGVAAVIVLAVGLGWHFGFNTHPSPEISMAERQKIARVEIGGSELLSQTQGAGESETEEGHCRLGDVINPAGFKTKVHFADSLDAFTPQNSDQQACKAYWEGWLSLRESQYAGAITAFEKVPFHPTNMMAQQAEQGLLIAYVLGNEDAKALILSKEIASRKPDEVFYRPAYDFAKSILKTTED